MKLLLEGLLFIPGLVDVGLEGRTFVIKRCLGLLNFLHIVLHLILEVALEEADKVVLDIDFLDLVVDGPQLVVNLGLLQAAQTTELPSHLNELLPFLVLSVQLALLIDLSEDLRPDQVKLEVDLE